MRKNTVSEKQGTSWLATPRKVKPGADIRDFDTVGELADPSYVKKAIFQALEEGDGEAVVEILRAHLRVLNRTKAAYEMQLSRTFVHEMIRGAKDPSVQTLGKFMHLLKTEQISMGD